MKALFVVVVCLGWVGCINSKPPGMADRPLVATEFPAEWKLVSENQTIQIDTSHVREVGRLSADDRDEILKQVGRVEGIRPEIAEILVFGDNLYTAAVRVTAAEKYTIYLVRLKGGAWVVSHVVVRMS